MTDFVLIMKVVFYTEWFGAGVGWGESLVSYYSPL